MQELIRKTEKGIKVREDEYIKTLDENERGWEYYQCEDGEYVANSEVYLRKYATVRKEVTEIYCPLCETWIDCSEHLQETFGNDDKMLWLTNMVTHYRHVSHLQNKIGSATSYDKTWGRNGYGYSKLQPQTHDEMKHKQNEIEKRKMIKQLYSLMNEKGITTEHFLRLHRTTDETVIVANKHLKR